MKNDLSVKAIVDQVGAMIDSRLKTNNVIIIGTLMAEIKAAEVRIRKEMATKDDIKRLEGDITELKKGQNRIEKDLKVVKEDVKKVDSKLDKRSKFDDKRFEAIEDELSLPRTNKN